MILNPLIWTNYTTKYQKHLWKNKGIGKNHLYKYYDEEKGWQGTENPVSTSIFKTEKADSTHQSRESAINSGHYSKEILKNMLCKHSKREVLLPSSQWAVTETYYKLT